MNKNLENIAKRTIKKSGVPEDTYGSVILVLMFVSIILTAFRIIQECDKNKLKNMSSDSYTEFYKTRLTEISEKRGWYTKMRLKKIIRKELKREEYKKYGNQIVLAVLDTAKDLTDEEIHSIIGAI